MAILNVGVGQQYSTISSAIAASRDGDTIAVQAGTYYNDFATINTKITIVGVGGTANLVATQQPGNGKGIFVTNTDVRIENLAFSGVSVPDGNGAGIRYQGGNLTIVNSHFHDNEMGLLANTSAGGKITIIDSEFDNSNSTKLLAHNLYIGEIDTLTISGSYFHDASVGHQIKSRAHNTVITDSRIYDGSAGGGTGSYSIDIPNGGNAVITGNVIQQSSASQNPAIIHFGGEGTAYGGSSLLVSDNTVVNQLNTSGARLLANQTNVTATVSDNAVFGLTSGQIAYGPANVSGTRYLGSAPALDTGSPWLPDALPTITVSLNDTTPTMDAAVTGTVAASGALSGFTLAYQWQSMEGSGWTNIAGATGRTFTPQAGEAGESLRLRVTVSDGSESVVAYSAGTGVTGRHVVGSGNTADTPALTAGADLVQANGGPDRLAGLAGADTLEGGAGHDTLDGGAGNDRMLGGSGNDLFVVNAAGDQVIEAAGGGLDRVQTSLTTYVLPRNVEEVVVTAGSGARISGNALDNLMIGGGGADTLHGGPGNDTLDGGGGNDRLLGGIGDDVFIVQSRGDAVGEAANAGTDTVVVTGGTGFTLRANIEALVLEGSGVVTGVGNGIDNVITGNAGANVLWGMVGDDTINGDGGADIIVGGLGRDVLTGGAGGDLFRFLQLNDSRTAAPDHVTDFVAGQDRIDLRNIDANTQSSGDDAFTYVAQFSGDAGELMVAARGGGEYQVRGDIDGNGTADFAIDVTSASAPTAGWFLL
jgi:Ca2+-binding RTX toxin-like protein